jgi:hypothetical protein
MAWINGPLTVYHGTDNRSAFGIFNYGINPNYFVPQADFGAGFYVTTSLHQAKNFANERTRTKGTPHAEVVVFELDRSAMEKLKHLTFVVDTSDYHDLVDFCWTGGTNHGPYRINSYDVIYGPVSMHPQTHVMGNCDQIYFSDPSLMPILGKSLIQSQPNRYF